RRHTGWPRDWSSDVCSSDLKEPDLPRPYRAWGYPVVPGIFVVGAFALTVNLFVQRPIRSSIGLLLILAGLPFYRYWSRARSVAEIGRASCRERVEDAAGCVS